MKKTLLLILTSISSMGILYAAEHAEQNILPKTPKKQKPAVKLKHLDRDLRENREASRRISHAQRIQALHEQQAQEALQAVEAHPAAHSRSGLFQ